MGPILLSDVDRFTVNGGVIFVILNLGQKLCTLFGGVRKVFVYGDSNAYHIDVGMRRAEHLSRRRHVPKHVL